MDSPGRVFRAQDGDFRGQMACLKSRKCLVHPRNGPAKHGLYRVGYQGVFHGTTKSMYSRFFSSQRRMLFPVRPYFEHDGAFSALVESEYRVASKLHHGLAEVTAGGGGQKVTIESLSCRDRVIAPLELMSHRSKPSCFAMGRQSRDAVR